MSYVELTLGALESFGVHVRRDGARRLLISGGQRYAPQDVTVEGDYSGTAFFEALNHIGGDVDITGLSENSRQGDRVYTDYFKKLSEGTPSCRLRDCPVSDRYCLRLRRRKRRAIYADAAAQIQGERPRAGNGG